MATDYKPADLNKDGEVTPKERAKYRKTKEEVAAAAANKPKPGKDQQDKLGQAQLEKMFGFAKDIIWKDPDLRQLYKDAIREQYTPEMFQSKLRSTGWYRDNAEPARLAWAAEKIGGEDWAAQMEEANLAIDRQAAELGARLDPAQRQALARRYIYEGWNDPKRAQLMSRAMANDITAGEGFMRGESGGLQEKLAEVARRNGVQLSQGYFESAARSVASGLTMEDDWMREVREQAASKWPTYRDRIMSGIDVEDLASGYINTMAQVWEVSPDSITLDDPNIRQALQGVGEDGKPKMQGLWEFEYQLKSDPRWTGTKNGANEVANVGMDILRRMGFQS
jgi:hypothetical protein